MLGVFFQPLQLTLQYDRKGQDAVDIWPYFMDVRDTKLRIGKSGDVHEEYESDISVTQERSVSS
jgi:hypothetical protein